jgi:hypothetical protein
VNCRTGCPTQDHESYAECLRNSTVRIAYSSSASNMDYSAQKRWDRELAEYRDLKAQGIQPGGSTRYHLDKAKQISDETGKPFVA